MKKRSFFDKSTENKIHQSYLRNKIIEKTLYQEKQRIKKFCNQHNIPFRGFNFCHLLDINDEYIDIIIKNFGKSPVIVKFYEKASDDDIIKYFGIKEL